MQAITHPIAPARERRFVIMALVGALHIAAIYTLLVTLDIVPPPIAQPTTNFHIIPLPQHPTAPPSPPTGHVVFAKPDDPAAVTPVFQIGQEPGPGAITNLPPAGMDTFVPASALAGTHSTPDYPMLDRRLGHEGVVLLALSIDAEGSVTGASVEHSSGYDGLDAAAIAWVKAHWRYKPATRNGVAASEATKASVVFRLTQAPF